MCEEFAAPLFQQLDVRLQSLDQLTLCGVACATPQEANGNRTSLGVRITVALAIVAIAVLFFYRRNVQVVTSSPRHDAEHVRARRLAALGADSPSQGHANTSSPQPVSEVSQVRRADTASSVQAEAESVNVMREWRQQRRHGVASARSADLDAAHDTSYVRLVALWQGYIDGSAKLDDLWVLVENKVLTRDGAGLVTTVVTRAQSLTRRKTTFRFPDRGFVCAVADLANSNRQVFVRFVDKLVGEVMESIDQAAESILEFNARPDQFGDRAPSPGMDNDVLERRLQTQVAWVHARRLVVVLCGFVGAGTQVVSGAVGDTDGFASRVALVFNYLLFRLMGPTSKRFSALVHSWDVPAVMVVNEETAGFLLNSPFDPGTLLLCVLYTFSRLGHDFLRIAAQERRYFRVRCFVNAAKAVPTLAGADATLVRSAQRLEEESREVAQEAAHICTALLDYPEEFGCALGMDLMRDPVRLPCGQVVDRAFMIGHFRSSSTDPFTRCPLVEENLVAESELKGRIDAWVAERIDRFPHCN